MSMRRRASGRKRCRRASTMRCAGARGYLYWELEELLSTGADGGEEKVLQRKRGAGAGGLLEPVFELRPAVGLHLYCSRVPCGDAGVMGLPVLSSSSSLSSSEFTIATRQSLPPGATGAKLVGLLPGAGRDEAWAAEQRARSTIDGLGSGVQLDIRAGSSSSAGAGVVEHRQAPGKLRRKPGRGNATLSMSCSDKIARWNASCMPGGLLSLLLPAPIYISTIVIAADASSTHGNVGSSNPADWLNAVARGLFGRLEPIADALSAPYRVNKPSVVSCSPPPASLRLALDDLCSVLCGYSVSWDASGAREVLLGTIGRRQGTSCRGALSPATRSSLCKASLAQRILSVLAFYPGEASLSSASYSELKVTVPLLQALALMHLACCYLKAKGVLLAPGSPFEEWLKCPPHLLMFVCNAGC
eukprot:SM000142S00508  [mRNA]  locus=s142:26355:30054:- [translate_table: standard]